MKQLYKVYWHSQQSVPRELLSTRCAMVFGVFPLHADGTVPLPPPAQWDRFQVPEYLDDINKYLAGMAAGDYIMLPGGTACCANMMKPHHAKSLPAHRLAHWDGRARHHPGH